MLISMSFLTNMFLIILFLSKNMWKYKIPQKFWVFLRLNHEKLRIMSKTQKFWVGESSVSYISKVKKTNCNMPSEIQGFSLACWAMGPWEHWVNSLFWGKVWTLLTWENRLYSFSLQSSMLPEEQFTFTPVSRDTINALRRSNETKLKGRLK